ncbi:hypothetical protein DBZ36_15805 [Alginatibacterium sediminis]|uniref:Uncharacterized protein n=1 Tax=Alginatibacterium sediminis TaxID=2164068 RepID=A0A420E8T0_9ALTE|nr:DUF6776 family protein [Alginatibacterium sediminis]RKF15835.1 hypothetical protein DBZ36_15805 [Alginatibacterium sediminis]
MRSSFFAIPLLLMLGIAWAVYMLFVQQTDQQQMLREQLASSDAETKVLSQQLRSQELLLTQALAQAKLSQANEQQLKLENQALQSSVDLYQYALGDDGQQKFKMHVAEVTELSNQNHYRLELLVSNSEPEMQPILGQIELKLVGLLEGETIELETSEVLVIADAAKFSIQHIQRIYLDFRLPEGFSPDSLALSFKRDGYQQLAFDQNYRWQDLFEYLN